MDSAAHKILEKVRSRSVIYAVAAVVAVGVVIFALRFLDSQPAAQINANAAVPVTAAVAIREDVPTIVSVLGTVQSIDIVSVQARVNGPIVKLEFTPGQDVKENQELFLIDPRPYQAVLDQAQAQLAHDEGVLAEAQVDLTRYQLLEQENSIAKQQAEDQVYVVQQDKGTVQLDQANVEAAQLNLEFCHVAAPIPGRAGALLVDLGNLVGPSVATSSSTSTTSSGSSGQTASTTAMVMITQMQPIYATFNVPQNLLDEIKRNQAVEPLEVDAYSQGGKLLEKGRLTIIDNQVNTSTGTVLMQATFANADETLWPGEFVRVQLIVSIQKNVVTVPAQSVLAGPNGSYVYLIKADNTVQRIGVDVSDRQGTIAVIGKGLSGGENVVVDGQYRLDDGVKVAVEQTTEATQVGSE
jgi:membrane fusion protein, multidrug efflux system